MTASASMITWASSEEQVLSTRKPKVVMWVRSRHWGGGPGGERGRRGGGGGGGKRARIAGDARNAC
jgi:hypothetical protein